MDAKVVMDAKVEMDAKVVQVKAHGSGPGAGCASEWYENLKDVKHAGNGNLTTTRANMMEMARQAMTAANTNLPKKVACEARRAS
jgi:hypothetical protein